MLNMLYKKDELHEKFQDLESFKSYKRASDTNIQQVLIFSFEFSPMLS